MILKQQAPQKMAMVASELFLVSFFSLNDSGNMLKTIELIFRGV